MPIKDDHLKFLGFIVSFLILFISALTGWHTTVISQLPEHYVRLERYKEDHLHYKETLIRIENKLDKMIIHKTLKGAADGTYSN